MANPYDIILENPKVFQLGIISDSLNLNKNFTRAELATIGVKLSGLTFMVDNKKTSTPFKDVNGWAAPYVNLAHEMGLMNGVKKYLFNPNGKVTYVELLTVIMRVLEYEDGIDFKKYPEDYYSKALEIGLGNLYIPHDEVVTKEITIKTINKALSLKMKNSGKELSSLQLFIPSVTSISDTEGYIVDSKVYLDDLSFNTTLIGVFSGVLKGNSDFSGYKVKLLTKSDNVLESVVLNKNGSFSMEGFDISMFSKLQGYKYEIYSPGGTLVLWDDLD